MTVAQKPILMKGIEEATDRILKAIAKKERFIIYGDSDPDGVCSVIILEETIRCLAGRKKIDLLVYFPDITSDGYGINKKAIDSFLAPALFISVDCGMANVKEVEYANKKGFEIIIIDHHQALLKPPPASIIVNPRQESDNSPFKEFACGGLAYKLSKILFAKANKSWNPEEFLVLAMIATLFDQVPLKYDNKEIAKAGILALSYTKRKGLKALIEASNFENKGIPEIFSKIVHPLGCGRTRSDHTNEAYDLLKETSAVRAKKMAKGFLQKNKEKGDKLVKVCEEVDSEIENGEYLIFKGNEHWPLELLGGVASRICRKTQRPVFLYSIGKAKSQGSIRVPSGMDAVKAMKTCHNLLETYGGHALAAGFSIKNKNISQFKKCLKLYFQK